MGNWRDSGFPWWDLHLWDSFEDMVVKWTVSLTKIMHNPQRDKICSKREEFKAFNVNDRLTE